MAERAQWLKEPGGGEYMPPAPNKLSASQRSHLKAEVGLHILPAEKAIVTEPEATRAVGGQRRGTDRTD